MGKDRFFQAWLKGLSFSVPLVVVLAGLWGNSFMNSFNTRMDVITLAVNDLIKQGRDISIDLQETKTKTTIQDGINSEIKSWVIRMEAKVDQIIQQRNK